MSSSVKMIRPVVAELEIAVPKEVVATALDKAYANVGRTARISGFRRGKVPRSVVRRMFASAVKAEVESELMNLHFREALVEHQLEPISKPVIEADGLQEEADFHFKASFEVRPRLERVIYDDIAVERQPVSVTEDDVAKELEHLRSSMASVVEIPEARPARKGDMSTITMKRWVEGAWQEEGVTEREIVVGEGQAPASLDDALIGMNLNDEKVVDFGSAIDLDNNRVRYLVRLCALKERKLPALDDELAKDTGSYDTLDALKAEIRKRIMEARIQAEEQRIRHALFDAIREKNPMELPPTLVDNHAGILKKQLLGPSKQKADANDEQQQKTYQKLAEGAETASRNMVHQHLLMMEIARLENLSVTDDEVDAEIEEQARLAGIPVPMLRAEIGKEGGREELSSRILDRKIFDFVKSVVTISEANGIDASAETPATDDGKPADEVAKGSQEESTAAQEVVTKTAGNKNKASTTERKPAKRTAPQKSPSDETAKKAEGRGPVAKKRASEKTAAKKQ